MRNYGDYFHTFILDWDENGIRSDFAHVYIINLSSLLKHLPKAYIQSQLSLLLTFNISFVHYARISHKHVPLHGSWTIDGELLYRVPYLPISQQPGWNFYDYGAPWIGNDNPWEGASPMAPFDQKVHYYLLCITNYKRLRHTHRYE